MKTIFSFAFLLFGLNTFAQADSVAALPTGNSSRLKVLMVLEDTTAYPCPCNLDPEYKLYKFRIAKTFQGTPERNLVAVCAPKEDILQFNPSKEAGKEYWWVLCKECTISGLPVYRLCGKF